MAYKHNWFSLFICLALPFACQSQDTLYIHQKVGSKLKIALSNIDSLTFKSSSISTSVGTGSLSYIKSIADEYVFANDGYSDYNLTTPATTGGQLLSMKSKSNTLFGGKFVFRNDNNFTFGVNKCPSQPNGGYPLYHSSDGGFAHIYNGLDVSYGMSGQLSPDKPAVGEFYYICRLYLSTTYEAIMSGFGGPELKIVGNNTQLEYSNGDYKTAKQTIPAVIDRMRTVIFRFLYQNNQVSIYITDNQANNRLLGTLSISTASFFRNFAAGTTSHPMTHDFFGYIMKFGTPFTTAQTNQLLADLKSIYPIGQRPDKPMVYPVISFDGTDFVVTLNYSPSSSGAAFSPANSTIRWYLIDNATSSTGNGLDKQSILATSTGANLRLRKADYASSFPTTGTKNGIAVDITCVDTNGQRFVVPLTSEPFQGY